MNETTGPTSCAEGRCDHASAAARCECMWICGRGPTRLCCQLRHHADDDLEIEVLRNNRIYGQYRFGERLTALTFASRLRHTLEGNGWVAA
jgi:hypothetical protein